MKLRLMRIILFFPCCLLDGLTLLLKNALESIQIIQQQMYRYIEREIKNKTMTKEEIEPLTNMNKLKNITIAKIVLKNKRRIYTENKYEILEDEKGVMWIKNVHCWNGIHNLKFEGIEINSSWANEFPKGSIESKMWCNSDGLKNAKEILQKTLDNFLLTNKNK